MTVDITVAAMLTCLFYVVMSDGHLKELLLRKAFIANVEYQNSSLGENNKMSEFSKTHEPYFLL